MFAQGHSSDESAILLIDDRDEGIHGRIERIDRRTDPRFPTLHVKEITAADLLQFFPEPSAIQWRRERFRIKGTSVWGSQGEYSVSLMVDTDEDDEDERAKERFVEWMTRPAGAPRKRHVGVIAAPARDRPAEPSDQAEFAALGPREEPRRDVHSVTFEVSGVPRATKPLREIPYLEAINRRLSRPLRSQKQYLVDMVSLGREEADELGEAPDWLAEVERRLAAIEADEAAATRAVEACCRYHGRLVADVLDHPVIAALHLAFTDHRPVCLSPDMVWLLICQGVAQHVNANAEALRSRFVRHQGRARIVVQRDDFIPGSPENPWGEVIDEFSHKVREHIGPTYDLFLPRFSTTGPTERIAAEVVLLDAMQSYFEYVLMSMCGIPAVTLEGTADDWAELAERAEAFAQFDLEWWLAPLRPVLREFAAAARGDVRSEFWESIYKYGSFSGGSAVTGWAAAFFPYFTDDRGNPTRKNPWLVEGGRKLELLLAGEWEPGRFDLGGPRPDVFPAGLSRAPFEWAFLGRSIAMEFLGGFVGVTQDPETLTLRPDIGWAVRRG